MTATIVRAGGGGTGVVVKATPARLVHDRMWQATLCLLGAQLVGMLIFTTAQYHRFNLTMDFAAYSQAWAAIAHGHLDPYSSVYGLPFWRNDVELVMWPLALFYWVYPHALTLLWLQVFAVAGGELVVVTWANTSLRRSRLDDRARALVMAFAVALLVLTPWSWFTIGFDFHLEPFLALFALLLARDLYFGRYRRAWAWAILSLACSAAAGPLLVIAVTAASLLSGHRARRPGILMVTVAVCWLAACEAMGAPHFYAASVGSMYGYLANNAGPHTGMVDVVEGIVFHPLRAATMFFDHSGYVVGYVVSGGIIGLLSRWAVLPAAAVLLPGALNANVDFIHYAAAFQSWPAVLFLVSGSVLALQSLANRSEQPLRAVAAFGVLTSILAILIAASYIRFVPAFINRVSPGAARQLSAIALRVPRSAEILASQGVMGRFSEGHSEYPYRALGTTERFGVNDQCGVVFIFAPHEGTSEGYPSETMAAIDYVRDGLRAKAIAKNAGIWAFIWSPPKGTVSVRLP